MTRERAIAGVLAALVVAAAILVYAPVSDFPFVAYDDDIQLLENRIVRGGFSWQSARWALSSEWGGAWTPLNWISHMLDFSLFGSDAGGHHATNLLLHALNVLLLFLALRSATGDSLRPAAVALLLAVHPLHVESVAWVSERKGLLSTSFALASLWCYAVYARTDGPRARRFSLLFFAGGAMTKPMVLTLPFLFLLLDHWPLRRARDPGNPDGRSAAVLLREKWIFLLVAVGSGALSLIALRDAGMTREMAEVGLAPRLANALVSSVLYLWKLVWPARLTSFYPHPGLPGGTPWGALPVLGSLCALALLAVAAWRAGHPAARVGLAWYAVSMLPALGIVRLGSHAMADRYAYLPAIGIYVAVVWSGAAALARRPRALRYAGAALFCAALLAAGIASRRQLETWSSSERLFRHATRVTDANSWMHFNLANTLSDLGRTEEAIIHYQAAVDIDPGMARAHFRLANLLAAEGRTDSAIEHYRSALRRLPRFGGAREALGRLLVEKGDLRGAIDHYREEARLRPGSAEVWRTLAGLLRRERKRAEADRAREKAEALTSRGAPSVEEIRQLEAQIRESRRQP